MGGRAYLKKTSFGIKRTKKRVFPLKTQNNLCIRITPYLWESNWYSQSLLWLMSQTVVVRFPDESHVIHSSLSGSSCSYCTVRVCSSWPRSPWARTRTTRPLLIPMSCRVVNWAHVKVSCTCHSYYHHRVVRGQTTTTTLLANKLASDREISPDSDSLNTFWFSR